MIETSVCQIVLAARPQGQVRLSDFRLEEAAMPRPGPETLPLKVRCLSLDPYMRGRMEDRKSYADPPALGAVMPGESVATVLDAIVRTTPAATPCLLSPVANSRALRRHEGKEARSGAAALNPPRRARDERFHGVRRTSKSSAIRPWAAKRFPQGVCTPLASSPCRLTPPRAECSRDYCWSSQNGNI
jgi:hypothetical protein